MSNNKYKVLIVEDEANICSFIETLLTTNDYQALVAHTCTMGLTLFASHNPDLVILDLGLPDRDGLELAVQMRLYRTELRRVGFRRRVIVKLAYQLLMQCWKASPALLVESFIHRLDQCEKLPALFFHRLNPACPKALPSLRAGCLRSASLHRFSLPTVRRWPHTIGKRSGHRVAKG